MSIRLWRGIVSIFQKFDLLFITRCALDKPEATMGIVIP